MPSRGILISLAAFASACFPAATADGAAPAASYSLSAYNCSKMNCEPPFQSRKGAWSAATQDRVEMETGIPFQLRIASGPTFYGKSLATVQGDSITLSNHIQMANFEKWTRALKKPASQTVGPAYVAGNITDTLTIAGGDGIAYLLPIYEVAGTFASSARSSSIRGLFCVSALLLEGAAGRRSGSLQGTDRTCTNSPSPSPAKPCNFDLESVSSIS